MGNSAFNNHTSKFLHGRVYFITIIKNQSTNITYSQIN